MRNYYKLRERERERERAREGGREGGRERAKESDFSPKAGVVPRRGTFAVCLP